MDSRKQLLLICLIGVVIGFVTLGSGRFHGRKPAQVYTDPQYGFRIVSSDSRWTVSDTTGFSDVLLVMKSDTMVEGFIPNVSVTVEFLPHMLNAAQYAQKNQDCLATEGFEITSRGKKVIGDNIFYDLQGVNRHLIPWLRFRFLCLVKDQIGFTITCTAPQSCYTKFAWDFELVVSSFRFI